LKIAEVYLNQKNRRLDHAYDYGIPQHLETIVAEGMRVVVPFGNGNRRIEGFVTVVKEWSEFTGKTKKIAENIDTQPILNKEQIELCLWMKDFYCSLFYEALSYFTTGIRTRQEIHYRKNESPCALDLNETWFMAHYFKPGYETMSRLKVKADDQHILAQLVKKGVVEPQKSWKTISAVAETPDYRYCLTEKGRQALQDDHKIGKKQQLLLEYLRYKEMNEAELKMCVAEFSKSLEPLLLKNYVLKTTAKPQSASDHHSGPTVVLTEAEKKQYAEYQQLVRKNRGTLFHVFDAVSKYRLFFRAIEEKLRADQAVVIIFPEVNLTFQRMELFYKYFGERVGVFHGRLTPKERFSLFEKVRTGRIQVIIGVRSALFLPFKNLGLIIIDEEHDASHATSASPRFHITEIAEKISQQLDIPYLLADDVPRITIWQQWVNGKINKLQIGTPQKRQTKIDIIDMQKEIHSGHMSPLSRSLIKQLKTSLQQHRLGVLYLNNKGYANSIFCRNCGQVMKCPNCHVALKYRQDDQTLHCHYCGYRESVPGCCPVCGSDKIRYLGLGIEQLEEQLRKMFPEARIKTVQGNLKRLEIKKTNRALLNGEIDIIIGTQVLIKHFNFVNVGLAAALLIDRDLNQGDFRAAEVVYQTYSRFFAKTMGTETVGLIQTNEPANDTIYSIVNDSFPEFYRGEIQYRKLMKYPPCINMVVFVVFGKLEKETEYDAYRLYVALKEKFGTGTADAVLYKPVRLGATQGGNMSYQIVLKISDLNAFQKIMPALIKAGVIEALKSKVSIQINP
jgi:primosomal protein N' (replication factor Y)